MNCHLGWNEITLTTPFEYNGTDNLIVMMSDTSGGGWENNYRFYYSTTTDYKSLYYYTDYSPWDISSFTNNSSYGWSTARSNIRFYGCHEQTGIEFDDKLFVVDEPGTYIIGDTVAGSNGCDSIITRVLIVWEPHYDTICDREFTAEQTWLNILYGNDTTYTWHWNEVDNEIAGKTPNAARLRMQTVSMSSMVSAKLAESLWIL